MTLPSLQNIFARVLIPPVMALALAPAIFFSSCSDSEKRLPTGDTMSTVFLNVGGSSTSVSSRLAAEAPSNITSVSVTVTGAGMTPISVTDTVLAGTIELSIPAGPSRLFAVVVTTTDGIYSGTAIASLPAGSTVSVPVVMQYGGLFGLSNEGSIDNPVLLAASEGAYQAHTGSVGRGRSYYYTDPGTHLFLEISISALTDDADLIGYGIDAAYTSTPYISFGKNLCGRTKDETISINGPGVPYYFVVDGSHTKNGARFVIKYIAHGGMVTGGPPIGTIALPNLVPVGLPYESILKPADTINYYYSIVKPGTRYWVNGYDFDYAKTIQVFNSLNFTLQFTGEIVPAGGVISFLANELPTADDTVYLEVVASEGTQAQPIELYVDESTHFFQRANYCMVGGDGDSSYYRFPVTSPEWGNGYYFHVDSMLGDVDLYVYDDPDYSDLLGSSAVASLDPELVGAVFDNNLDGYIYVRVKDGSENGYGSTFMLYGQMNLD